MSSSASQLVPAFTNAMVAYHPGTAEHSARVGAIANAIGAELDLADTELEVVHWAGLLHDIGKLAVPAEILNKPGRLTATEWLEVERHPVVGSDILLALSTSLTPVAAGVRSHHERWDGSGYPDALAGSVIPIEGRIVALADVFDALTHPRSYRARVYPVRDAVAHLTAHAGTLFDPEVVEAFLRRLAAQH